MNVSKFLHFNFSGISTANVNNSIRRCNYRYVLLPLTSLFCCGSLFAQRDTTKKQSINIVSSFKPVLRNAVKINFSGSQLNADTSRIVKEYLIPSQNLFYAYQAIALKSLALQQDTSLYLGGRNFIKAGFGNYTTPYVNVGLGLGDGKQYLANLYGTFISSNGTISNQDYSQFHVKATGSYFLKKNELYAAASTSRDQYYLYGYDHVAFPDTKRRDISQQFQQINVSAGIRNTVSTKYAISYNPSIAANLFTSKSRLRETSFLVSIPVEKKIGENFNIKVNAKADLTRYSTNNLTPVDITVTNNLSQVAASVVYNTERVIINAGIIPVWDNGNFDYLPNVSAEVQLKEKVFMIQGGWIGRIVKNSYRNLSQINPYLAPVTSQTNTREVEFYGGVKATVGKHFNFNAKAGIVHFENFALFVNDNSGGTTTENQFNVLYEPKMESLRIHGDISYILQDKFTATAGVTMNGYTGLNVNEKAWNTVPVEINGSLRWWVLDQLLIKGDFYMFGGGKFRETDGKSRSFSAGSDLSAGAEFKVTRQFSAFLDVNNIFNNKYERWHRYQVYGLNLLGGVIFRF